MLRKKCDPSLIFNNSVNEFINKEFTKEELSAALNKLKNNKSCGYDNILNEFLKNCPENVLSLMVKNF